MTCTCHVGHKEKRDLFRRWLEQGQNLDNTESLLKVTRENASETTHSRELLTIAEMIAKGFSPLLDQFNSETMCVCVCVRGFLPHWYR